MNKMNVSRPGLWHLPNANVNGIANTRTHYWFSIKFPVWQFDFSLLFIAQVQQWPAAPSRTPHPPRPPCPLSSHCPQRQKAARRLCSPPPPPGQWAAAVDHHPILLACVTFLHSFSDWRVSFRSGEKVRVRWEFLKGTLRSFYTKPALLWSLFFFWGCGGGGDDSI